MFGISHPPSWPLRLGALALWVLGLVGLTGSIGYARVIHDDRGLALNLVSPAKRIVSLYPSLTESICLLNACDRLVGVDRSSNWPEWVQSVPHLGGLWDTSLEDLVRAQPDVVLMSASNAKLTAKLEALGLSVLVFQPQTLEQMKHTLRELAHLVEPLQAKDKGQELVERLIESMDSDLRSLQTQMPRWSMGKSIYLEVGAGGYAASESSYIGRLLEPLSLHNVVPQSLGEFPRMGREWLLRQSPDIIVLTHIEDKPLKRMPGLRMLRAVSEERVCDLNQEQSDRLLRLGPRVTLGLRAVVDCIQKMRPM